MKRTSYCEKTHCKRGISQKRDFFTVTTFSQTTIKSSTHQTAWEKNHPEAFFENSSSSRNQNIAGAIMHCRRDLSNFQVSMRGKIMMIKSSFWGLVFWAVRGLRLCMPHFFKPKNEASEKWISQLETLSDTWGDSMPSLCSVSLQIRAYAVLSKTVYWILNNMDLIRPRYRFFVFILFQRWRSLEMRILLNWETKDSSCKKAFVMHK